MTTPCELHLYHNSKPFSDKVAKKILKDTKALELKYNYFAPNSYLSKINNRTTDVLDIETKELLKRAKSYYKATNSIFDITTATIKDIYKLHNIKELEQEKARLLAFVGCENFEIKRDKILFSNPWTKIDFGGIVKEYAVDKAVQIIKKHKIKSALVNFGGDIYAVGKNPNNKKFQIGIKNPLKKETNLMFVQIEDEALTTSASYERNYEIQNQNFSHIISKSDKKSEILSATVISQNCVNSGVYSTSLMINNNMSIPYQKILIHKNLSITT
jgi:thiamine biosynthesis lipoprotein